MSTWYNMLLKRWKPLQMFCVHFCNSCCCVTWRHINNNVHKKQNWAIASKLFMVSVSFIVNPQKLCNISMSRQNEKLHLRAILCLCEVSCSPTRVYVILPVIAHTYKSTYTVTNSKVAQVIPSGRVLASVGDLRMIKQCGM